MFAPVFLDHNATTPLSEAVWQGMLPWLRDRFGNASSRHEYGRAARTAVEEARRQVAAAVGAVPGEVVFTSGGSESNNLLIKGFCDARAPGALAIGSTEHPCVYKPAEQMVSAGWQIRRIPVDSLGLIDLARYAEIVLEKPALVSVMMANNETGVVQDVAALAAAARTAGAVFHTDAAQVLGRMPLDFRALNDAGVMAMTLSAHKAGGPKGAGALILDKRLELLPLIAGGGQERGLRSGTENVAAIVGFGLACELAATQLRDAPAAMLAMREQLEIGLHALGASIFGQAALRLPNTVYFALPDIDGETLVGKLDRAGFAVASGAACSSANPEPSHVLAAMGVPDEFARAAVRVSLGSGNQPRQVEEFLKVLKEIVQQLKQLTAVAI